MVKKYITRRVKAKEYDVQVYNIDTQSVENITVKISHDIPAKKVERCILDNVKEHYPNCRLLDIVGYEITETRYRMAENDFINNAEKF